MKSKYTIPKAIVLCLDEETPLLATSLDNLENGTDGDAGSNRRTITGAPDFEDELDAV